jgi:hypothetical protein
MEKEGKLRDWRRKAKRGVYGILMVMYLAKGQTGRWAGGSSRCQRLSAVLGVAVP